MANKDTSSKSSKSNGKKKSQSSDDKNKDGSNRTKRFIDSNDDWKRTFG